MGGISLRSPPFSISSLISWLSSPQLLLVLFTAFLVILYFESQKVVTTQKYFQRLLPIPFGNDERPPFEINAVSDLPNEPFDENLYQTLSFTNASIWVNGHNLTFKEPPKTPKNKKLIVHLLLHSHIDPGWLRTFEEYYNEKVKTILTGAVEGLVKNVNLRFIWSEMSFLERWWKDATEELKGNFTMLLNSGRLELCGGGWVMTDEATPHFHSTIDNMIEGQTFIKKLLNVTPTTSWSVDPFGHGLMMPLLNSLSGIQNMVVGRLNDELKKEMRGHRSLQWRWKQPYGDEKFNPAPFVHTLPYLYYTTRNACGPDEQICCQGQVGPSVGYFACPGGINRYRNQTEQMRAYAEKLVNQWKMTQDVYGLEKILIPVGDDFYLSDKRDWEVVAESWGELLEVINGGNYNVKAFFSTVTEYFEALDSQEIIPALTGDFFPYLEKLNNPNKYWTGYFTHRPHHKRTERLLMGQLAALDLMKVGANDLKNLEILQLARRDVALFQHHDGITGTSKPHVMDDYLFRLRNASMVILNEQSRLVKERHKVQDEQVKNSIRPSTDKDILQPAVNVFTTGATSQTLSVFNPLPARFAQKITFTVESPMLSIKSMNGPIKHQILPRRHESPNAKTIYEVIFFDHLHPLDYTEYTLSAMEKLEPESESIIYVQQERKNPYPEMHYEATFDGKSFKTKFGSISLNFGKTIEITSSGNFDQKSLVLDFLLFDDYAGAYVFEGSEKESVLTLKEIEYIVDGPLETQVAALFGSDLMNVKTLIRINHESLKQGYEEIIEIDLLPKLPDKYNVFMRLRTDIENIDEKKNTTHFSTDINAMYMFERFYENHLPFAANIFATPTAGFIQDSKKRLSVFTGQPCGMSSKRKGELWIHADRQLSTQDGKGLSMMDAWENRQANPKYRIRMEKRATMNELNAQAGHSIQGKFTLDSMLFPPAVFLINKEVNDQQSIPEIDWNCGIEIVSSRFIDEKTILVILRRNSFEKFDEKFEFSCGDSQLKGVWKWISSKGEVFHASLTGTHRSEQTTEDSLLSRLGQPLAIASFLVDL
ncbi:unnamed protein product, partial [Mesorhabditis belari]|uniref:Alpha-mannosidase n=1 Tax=Mesorhabditis belari TaxID=2138241 RepID=A0AAF3FIK6_9BILA